MRLLFTCREFGKVARGLKRNGREARSTSSAGSARGVGSGWERGADSEEKRAIKGNVAASGEVIEMRAGWGFRLGSKKPIMDV